MAAAGLAPTAGGCLPGEWPTPDPEALTGVSAAAGRLVPARPARDRVWWEAASRVRLLSSPDRATINLQPQNDPARSAEQPIPGVLSAIMVATATYRGERSLRRRRVISLPGAARRLAPGQMRAALIRRSPPGDNGGAPGADDRRSTDVTGLRRSCRRGWWP